MKSYLAFLVFLGDIYGVNTGFPDAEKSHITEDTGIRQMSAPVPAVHIVGFSDMAESVPGVFASPGRAFGKSISSSFQGRV